MAWNRTVSNNESINVETQIEVMPKCVKLAGGLCSLVALVHLALGFNILPGPYPYLPWTVCAGYILSFIALAYCCRMIVSRNMIGLTLSILVLFVVELILYSIVAAIILAGVPLVCLLLPTSRRWLKANNSFRKASLFIGIFLVCAAGALSMTHSVTEKYISDRNPIWVFTPGDKPIHPLDDAKEHRYDYWQNGCLMGNCIVKYNQNDICCFAILNICNPTQSKNPQFYGEIQQELKEECERRFGSGIAWTVLREETGFPTMEGRTPGDVRVDIFSPTDDEVYCSLVVYDQRLTDSVLHDGHGKREQTPRQN